MSDDRARRQLLFGMLGVNCGLLLKEDVVRGLQSWTQNKHDDLPNILLQRRCIEESQYMLLQALVEEHLKQHSGDIRECLQSLSSVDSLCCALAQLDDDHIEASLPKFLEEGTATYVDTQDADETSTAPPPKSSHSEGRFVILGFLAKGGLGSVSIAKDKELDRHVALKQILPKHADNTEARIRFQREAEITGRLEHPGIVPVYGLGTYEDGRPFYAMKLIEGDSLKDAIEQFHSSRESCKAEFYSREFQNLLRRLIDVCNAIQYAHDRHVLHRDLKPANVMVGRYGETLVVDWGLAKPLAERSSNPNDTIGTEPTGKPIVPKTSLSGSGSTETQTGMAKGTPSYMSPEQARGDWGQLGPATDIYAIGATLYTVLTGKAPVTGKTAAEVVIKAARGEWVPPRRIVLGIPAALDAVCCKALAPDPNARYESASAMAADLERWLADEPVSARKEPASDRLTRLTRKHRGAVLTAMVASVLLAFLGMTASYAIYAQKQQADALADKNANLATLEGAQRKLSEQRGVKLRAALAENYFLAGLAEDDAGRPRSALVELHRALAFTEVGDPLFEARSEVFRDRATQQGRTLGQLMRHGGGVRSVRFSPDGTRLATASLDMTARLWDAETGAPLGQPMWHRTGILSVAFSPDGTRLATASLDRTARLWDAMTGAPLARPMQHEGTVWSVAFSPDGTRLATASDDKSARLWDTRTGEPLAPPMRHERFVRTVAFSPDGTRLASGSEDRTARLWDAMTGASVGQPMRHEHSVGSVAFSPDGTLLATASPDRTARLWDAMTGVPLAPPMRHESVVWGAEFSPDATRIATASGDIARLWDTKTGTPLGEPMRHEDMLHSVAFSPDGTQLVTASFDKTARLWDANTGAPLGQPMRHERQVYSVVFSPDGAHLATASEDGTAQLWDARTGTSVIQTMRHEGMVNSVTFSPDGNLVATASSDKTARLWDRSTSVSVTQPMRHEGAVHSVVFSSDTTRIATASEDKTARLWDANTGAPLGEPMRHEGPVWLVAFSPDGTRLATASKDKTARLWDANTGAPLVSLMPHRDLVRSIAFSPDGTRLATASGDGTARLWDARTGAPLAQPMWHESGVISVVFSPDGMGIATVSWDKTARLWDAKTGVPLAQPMRHEGTVVSAAFSPDGTQLATASDDRTARLWCAKTGAPLAQPMRHESSVNSVAFSSDGTRLATASNDKTARLWDTKTAAQLGLPMQHEGMVNSVTFQSDGTSIATASSDANARLWDVEMVACPSGKAMLAWAELLTDVRVDTETGAATLLSVDERKQLHTEFDDTLARFREADLQLRNERLFRTKNR